MRLYAAVSLIILFGLTACNLDTAYAPPLTPSPTPIPVEGIQVQGPDGVRLNIVTATPVNGAQPVGGQVVVPTQPGVSVQVDAGDPIDAGTGGDVEEGGVDITAQDPNYPPPGGNIADWLITNVLIPAWNFLYTFVIRSLVSLWDFAGERGGIIARVLCCIVPFILLGAFLVRRMILGEID